MVLSWNEKTGEREYKEVTNLWVRETNLLYEIILPGQEPIVTTWNHPFWSVTQSAWIETKDLKVGEILSLEDGSVTSIESINHYETEETTVYNFEVEGNHTYYVSEAGVLVHNEGSAYNGVVTDPMQILYSMFAPVKKEQVSAALKKVDEPKSAMDYAACNGPTGALCTGAKVTGHLMDGEYSEAGDIVVDRAGENILGFAVGYGIGGLFGIGKSFSAVPKKLGVIYKIPGKYTETGKPYIGSANDLLKRAKTAKDGRDRSNTEILDYYLIGDKNARRAAEQKQINLIGRPNYDLDNKRNEIKIEDWWKYGL